MRCEEVQNLLAVEADGLLLDSESTTLNEHLSECPLCRQQRDDIRAVSRDLRMMRRPAIPSETLYSIRSCRIRSTRSPAGLLDLRRPAPVAPSLADAVELGYSRLGPYGRGIRLAALVHAASFKVATLRRFSGISRPVATGLRRSAARCFV